MSSIQIAGNTSGSVTLSAPDVAGTTTLTLPTTSGTVTTKDTNGILSVNGVQFPATQSASADANCLDDYEEGTWTPTGNGVNLTGNGGWYTKIGHMVHVGATWTYPSNSNTSAAQVSGLPFTSNSGDDNYMGCVSLSNYGSDNLYAVTSSGTTSILVRNNSNADLTNANLSGRFVKFMAIYKV